MQVLKFSQKFALYVKNVTKGILISNFHFCLKRKKSGKGKRVVFPNIFDKRPKVKLRKPDLYTSKGSLDSRLRRSYNRQKHGVNDSISG